MKNKFMYIISLFVLSFSACTDFIDLEPKDKLAGEKLFSDPEGLRLYMANLYYQLPIEDFAFVPEYGFNMNTGGQAGTGGFTSPILTDEALHSEWGGLVYDGDFNWFSEGYRLVRDVNILIETIPSLEISDEEKGIIMGECSFIVAYAYYGLAKRYGGVPLINEQQHWTGDLEAIKIPRSTEKETWDYILDECNKAISLLPDSWNGGQRRANRWVAYALKSRVALHAASIAKFWDKAPLSGEAVDFEFVGISKSEANRYYEACIEASEAIINSGRYSLYKPNPANPQEAAENYRNIFEFPNNATEEAIFIKGFTRPGDGTGHNYDIWYSPNQLSNGFPHPGRMNPTLDLVDSYENYSSNGESIPIITATNDEINDYNGYNPDKDYIRFDNPYDIFRDKDARLWGTVILPGTEFKGSPVIIQAGFITPDGIPVIERDESINVNGTEYYTFGASDWSLYSGFDTRGGNYTRTGFGFKKFLTSQPIINGWSKSTTDWIDFRYAEILLNYAEAVVENDYTDDNSQTKAQTAINSLRRRAGHTNDIPLTIENVLRERKVELAFENMKERNFWHILNLIM